MTPAALLTDAFARVLDDVRAVLDGLGDESADRRPAPDANPIGWLIWHLTRVQDDHVSEVAGVEQVYTAQGFAARFALPYPDDAHGYGHTRDDVDAFSAPVALLLEYYEAVHRATLAYVSTLTEADLDRVVDTSWDPPVTLGVRLISVINDDTQHVGQAAYVRGLLDG